MTAYDMLLGANETNETEFVLAALPTPAPTRPQTSYTMFATIENASAAPSLESLTAAASIHCGGCKVTLIRQFKIKQTLSFSGVPCASFTDDVANLAVADANNVPSPTVSSWVTCAVRRLGQHERRLQGVGTGSVSIDASITVSDAAQADDIKTAAASSGTSNALRAAFQTATGIASLPQPIVQPPQLELAVTYTVESASDTIVVVPTVAEFTTSLAAADPIASARLTFTVETPVPTPAPTIMPTPLPPGATYSPTVSLYTQTRRQWLHSLANSKLASSSAWLSFVLP